MDAAKKPVLEKRLVIGLSGMVAVTLLLGLVRQFTGSLAGPRAAHQAAPSLVAVALAASEGTADTGTQDAPRPPAYLAQGLRDPLKPLLPEPGQLAAAAAARSQAGSLPLPEFEPPEASSNAAEAAPPALQVQGLVWGGPEPQAVINGQLYSVDDMVEGGRILAIDHRGVTIEHGGVLRFYAPASSASASFDRFEQPMAGRFHHGR